MNKENVIVSLQYDIAILKLMCDHKDSKAILTWLNSIAESVTIEEWAVEVVNILYETECMPLVRKEILSIISEKTKVLQDVGKERALKINVALNAIKPYMGDGFYCKDFYWKKYCVSKMLVARSDENLQAIARELGVDNSVDIGSLVIWAALIQEPDAAAPGVDIFTMLLGLYRYIIQDIDVKIIEALFQKERDENTRLLQTYMKNRLIFWESDIEYEWCKEAEMARMCSKLMECAALSRNRLLFEAGIQVCIENIAAFFNTDEDIDDLLALLLLESAMLADDALYLIKIILEVAGNYLCLNLCVTTLLACSTTLGKKDCLSYLLSNHGGLIDYSISIQVHSEMLDQMIQDKYIKDVESVVGNHILQIFLCNGSKDDFSELLKYQKDRIKQVLLNDMRSPGKAWNHPIVISVSEYIKLGFYKQEKENCEALCRIADIGSDELPNVLGILLSDLVVELPAYFQNMVYLQQLYSIIRIVGYAEKRGYDISPYYRSLNIALTKILDNCSKDSSLVILEAVFGKAKFIRNWFSDKGGLGIQFLNTYFFKDETFRLIRAVQCCIRELEVFPIEMVMHIMRFYIMLYKGCKNTQIFLRVYCNEVLKVVCSGSIPVRDRVKDLGFHVPAPAEAAFSNSP